VQPAEIVEHINGGTFTAQPEESQIEQLRLLQQSIKDSYANFGKTYVKSYREYFPELDKTILPIVTKVKEFFPEQSLNILDIGSGPGEDLAYLQSIPSVNAVGLEPSPFFIDMCRHKVEDGVLERASVFQGVGEDMPFEADKFHLVYARNSLLHVPYITDSALGATSFFKEVVRVLKKEGILYLHLREGDRGYIQESTGRFFQLYSCEMIEKLAHNAGMKVLSMEQTTNKRFPTHNWKHWLEVYMQL
jgi:SAM-dependent methyltransferase